MCGITHLLPTLAKLAGGEAPSDRVIDGGDIRPLMAGKLGAKSPHEAYYYYKGTRLEAVRYGNWKLIRKKQPELYDLEADISEEKNLASEHPDVVKRLSDLMDKFDAELKANARPAGKVL